jgi:hypothetical protein
MKIKTDILVFFTICSLVILSCDFLFGDEDNNGNGSAQTGIVEPLIQTKWGQGNPFNGMLPMNGDTRAITGCGVIATAMIMKFHEHPARGSGWSEQYTISTGVQEPVNLDVVYDWNNMLNTYTSSATEQQRNAVATLAYHVGVAWKRDFITGIYSFRNLPVVLNTFFDYDKSIQLRSRVYYDDVAWEAMIRQQLDAELPVFYMGFNQSRANHGFIVDGYDNNGMFHINWGWSGRHDGWYSLNNLNPTSRGREWYNDQFIVINIKPNEGGVSAGYELVLRNFSVNKTSVPQNELFSVSAQVSNISNFDTFQGGRWGVALVDDNDNIIIMGNASIQALTTLWSTLVMSINCIMPETVNPGQYRLKIAIRPTDEEDWKIITKSAVGNGVPNNILFTVMAGEANGGGYGMALTAFSVSKTTVSQNETFTVTNQFRNMASEQFPGGHIGAALVDNNGNIAAVVGTSSIGRINSGVTGSERVLDCTIPDTVHPGHYQLRMVVRPTGEEQWRVATLALPDVPNRYDFIIQ